MSFEAKFLLRRQDKLYLSTPFMELCFSGHRGVNFCLEWKQNSATRFPTREEVYLASGMALGNNPCY